jgi:hypothetical protein
MKHRVWKLHVGRDAAGEIGNGPALDVRAQRFARRGPVEAVHSVAG